MVCVDTKKLWSIYAHAESNMLRTPYVELWSESNMHNQRLNQVTTDNPPSVPYSGESLSNCNLHMLVGRILVDAHFLHEKPYRYAATEIVPTTHHDVAIAQHDQCIDHDDL